MWRTIEDVAEAKRECVEVMRESEAVYVTTLDEYGTPVTRALFNLRRKTQFPELAGLFNAHDNDLLVYLSTNTSSEKVGQIRQDPRVALYYHAQGTTRGVMLAGRATFETDLALKRTLWQEGWEVYYPGGLEDSDFSVISLTPDRIRGWLGDGTFDVFLGETR